MSKKIDIEKFIPELLPIEKSVYQQINDVKTTIIKIFTNRGFINKSNTNKYIEKFIEDENDDLEYIVSLDNSKNYNTEIKNKKVYVKIFNYKISSVSEKSQIGEFLKKYNKEYKFIIVQDITAKTDETINLYDTQVEIFKFNKLQSDITEHVLVPLHEVLTKEDGENVLESYRARKRDMPLIRSNEDVAKYYNMKPGEIIKIYRPSPITCESVSYRLVIKSTDSKIKT
jgi:DNA-directed RNA polymerase subunit H (RpoH/RPB5)